MNEPNVNKMIDDESNRNLLQLRQDLNILTQIIRTVHVSNNLDDIYDAALDSVLQLDNVDIAIIYLVDEESNEAVIQAHRNIPESSFRKIERIPYAKGITWKVINTGKIINVEDAQADPDIGPAGKELGFHSIFSFPIFLEEKVIGAIHFLSNKERKFNKGEMELLGALGNQIAIAISRVKMNNLLQKQNRYKSIVNTISKNVHSSINLKEVLDNAVNSLSDNVEMVNNVLVYLVENNVAVLKAYVGELDENYLKNAARISYPKGATWATINGKESRYVPDVDNDKFIGSAGRELGIQSYMSTPIEYKDKCIGCIHIHSNEKYSFGIEELDLLNTVSHQIQTAIANARNAEAVKQSEERYRTLFYQSPAGVYTFDNNLVITECNERMAQIIGTSSDKIIGLDMHQLEDKSFLEGMKKTLNGEIYIKKESPYKTTLTSKELWLSFQVSPLYNSDNEVIGGMAVVEDTTDKKETEKKLLQSQRLESIGTLAGGIAHNLNNVFQPIMMSLHMLDKRIDDEQCKNTLNIIEESVYRGKSLVDQVLSFARGSEFEHKSLELENLLKGVRSLLDRTFPKDIEIKIEVQNNTWRISGDITQLHQVFMNMCVNARDAMPDGGKLTISVENINIDEIYSQMNVDAQPGPYVLISIVDTGHGIHDEDINNIFDPFYTTKEPDKGTGLGLSTSYSIVKDHGGFIDIKSKVGEGTEFKIYLPAVRQDEVLISKTKRAKDIPKGNGELVLVVDDEAAVREITKLTLESNEYRVITASDGAEAIAVYTKNTDDVVVVIMDMMMPVMKGPESITAIRKINPEVKIIASTGIKKSGKSGVSDIDESEVETVLKKPYTTEELLNTVHEVIKAD